MGSGIHKTTLRNINSILDLLREVGEIHVRGIAKALNLNPFIVNNILERYLIYFLDIRDIEQFGIRIKIVRFKPGAENTTLETVLRYIELKRRIKSS